MPIWFLLLIGIITYFMVQRSVARITKTPVWLLWLVLMAAPLLWTGWSAVYGLQVRPPSALMIATLVISLILYWVLFQLGRRPSEATQESTAPQSQLAINPIAEPPTPARPIKPDEETQLRNCFPWSLYYLQDIEYRPQAVICKGQLRTDATAAYQQIRENIEAEFGDRFLVMLQEGFNGKPIFVLVPNTQLTKYQQFRSEKLTRPGLALALLFATLMTTTLVGAQRIAGVEAQQLKNNLGVLLQGLPYALALLTILGIHELAHYLTARRYKIRATLPYFIPMPYFLGTFGAFIQMRSPVPNRKALFDISVAGPIAGFIATLPILAWGLAHSTITPLTEQSGLFNPDSLNPRYSILLALISKLVLGSQLITKTAIDLHPVAFAGLLGLVVTALNLVPVGQLDGGHIIHAMFGQRNAIFIGQIARFLLLLLAFVQPGFLLWAIMLIFVPLIDEPALNDVTELNNQRDILGILSIALLILIVLPLPNVFVRLLGL